MVTDSGNILEENTHLPGHVYYSMMRVLIQYTVFPKTSTSIKMISQLEFYLSNRPIRIGSVYSRNFRFPRKKERPSSSPLVSLTFLLFLSCVTTIELLPPLLHRSLLTTDKRPSSHFLPCPVRDSHRRSTVVRDRLSVVFLSLKSGGGSDIFS